MAKKENIKRKWYIVDAKDKVLGRLSSKIANILTGKNKPEYTPHVDTGDGVIIINAKYIKVTGKKSTDKVYTRFSGYPGGLKKETFSDILSKAPTKLISHAVKGMLPKNKLGSSAFRRLKVYPEDKYSHAAQKPQKIVLSCPFRKV